MAPTGVLADFAEPTDDTAVAETEALTDDAEALTRESAADFSNTCDVLAAKPVGLPLWWTLELLRMIEEVGDVTTRGVVSVWLLLREAVAMVDDGRMMDVVSEFPPKEGVGDDKVVAVIVFSVADRLGEAYGAVWL
jgi:hypothetical protein